MKKSQKLEDEVRDLLRDHHGEPLHGRTIWAVMTRVRIIRKRAERKARRPKLLIVSKKRAG